MAEGICERVMAELRMDFEVSSSICELTISERASLFALAWKIMCII